MNCFRRRILKATAEERRESDSLSQSEQFIGLAEDKLRRGLSVAEIYAATPTSKIVIGRPSNSVSTLMSAVERFTNEETCKSIAIALLQQKYRISRQISLDLSVSFLDQAKEQLSADEQWCGRLELIYKGTYPKASREVLINGAFAYSRYISPSVVKDKLITFQSEEFDYLPLPKPSIVQVMAPVLFEIGEVIDKKSGEKKLKLVKTPEADRFVSCEKDALPKSALNEVVLYNRPLHGIVKKWKYTKGKLPLQIVPAKLKEKPKPNIVEEFLSDLHQHFSWENDECFTMYVCYIIQPMLVHLYAGQLPGYAFVGPTKSGKGYLSSVFPNIVYRRPGAATVVVKKIPDKDYEFDVFLYGARDVVFVVFDEVMLAAATQLKLIDTLLTENVVQIRKLNQGYVQIPNYFTVALTGVNMSLTDETDGRIASIRLTESTPESVDDFHRRWCDRGAVLLASLFEKVNNLKIDLASLPQIPHRRPGFGLMSYVLENAFGLKTTFPLQGGCTELLDSMCKLYESVEPTKQSGAWNAYSLKKLQDFLLLDGRGNLNKRRVEELVYAALPYNSTRCHPNLKDTGYQMESGKKYHVEIRKEGAEKRIYIFVQPVDSMSEDKQVLLSTKTTKSTDSDPVNFANLEAD